MAIATLDACFDNPKVFSGVVKIRKGMAARLILDSSSMGGVHRWFFHFADAMGKRCPESDPSREALLAALHRIKEERLGTMYPGPGRESLRQQTGM